MKLKLILFLIAYHLLLITKSYAIYDPLSVANNKYGIHIVDPNDIIDVAPLVNSNGGSWGYVTLVISDKERDIDFWSKQFELMRRLKLIPIVRIATHTEGSGWVAPKLSDLDNWIKFLSDLPWPLKNRYIILFNEVNHTAEWGEAVNPEEYAEIFISFAKRLKDASTDFFILPAGLDASAPSNSSSLDEAAFLSRIAQNRHEYFDYLDGWTSHSYPNPAFSGSPYASGRGTLKTYEWELELLKSLGVNKNFPVFITETGWSRERLSPGIISSYIQIASQTVWNDLKIAAVTPFLFQYQQKPFDIFSWLIPGSRNPQPFYLAYQNIPKPSGNPHLYPSLEYLALLRQELNF